MAAPPPPPPPFGGAPASGGYPPAPAAPQNPAVQQQQPVTGGHGVPPPPAPFNGAPAMAGQAPPPPGPPGAPQFNAGTAAPPPQPPQFGGNTGGAPPAPPRQAEPATAVNRAPPPPSGNAAAPLPPVQQGGVPPSQPPPAPGVPPVQQQQPAYAQQPPMQQPPAQQAPPPMQQQSPPMQQAPPPMQQSPPVHQAPPPVQQQAPPMPGQMGAPPVQQQQQQPAYAQQPPMQQPPAQQQYPPQAGAPPQQQQFPQAGATPTRYSDPASPADAAASMNVKSPAAIGNGSFGAKTPTTPGGTRPTAQRARPKQGTSRIDSSQVPTPCRDMPPEDAARQRPMYHTSRGIPPLSVTNFIGVDEGNPNPKFIRPTLHSVPHDEHHLKELNVPLGAVLAPLYQPLESSEAPPIVTGRKPIRCARCRAYINAWSSFIELGRRWNCQFCGMSNDVDSEYFANLDNNGRRRDADEKGELSRGTVEFDVDQYEEYALRDGNDKLVKTQPMHHLFIVDISQGAKGQLGDIVASLQTSLATMAERYPECNVSFITYASTLQFYNFRSPGTPQMVVPDVENPFVPLPFTLMCWMNLAEDFAKITEFVDRLPELSDAANETGSCIGAAVKVASLVLSTCGGKVILTGSQLPSSGVGAIKARPQHKLYGTDEEKQLLRPIDGFWSAMGVELAKKQISVDLLMFPTEYCELITIGQVCHLTNGTQTLFLNYDSHDQLRLQVALERALLQEAGYGAILRVRCSDGIRVKSYNGHFLSTDPKDMDLATIAGSSTFFLELCHESKLDPKGYAFLQVALLYTTRSGHRRVRLQTLRLTVSNAYAALFRNADLEACAFAMVHNGIHDAVNKGPKAAREALQERTIKTLIAYRRYCSQGSHTGQLLLPEQLKLLPLYTLAMMKSDALVPGTDTRIDERVQCIFDLMTMPVHRLLGYLYPKIYAVQNLGASAVTGTINANTGLVHMPPIQQLTSDIIMTHGVYILHDQQARLVYLWIGSNVTAKSSMSLFGIEDAKTAGTDSYPVENFGERLRNVLDGVCRHENGIDRLVICHEKESTEEGFWRNMVEDVTGTGTQSYSDFLCVLHKQINTRLS